MGIITLGAKPGMDRVLPAGIVAATEELLVAAGAAPAWAVRWARSSKMVSVYEAFDWILPGQFEALAHRKAFCERQVRDGISSGATQVLVLGSGYDTLGWRLSTEFPDVGFFEIDLPATARLKAKGVETMGCRDNLHLIPEDLGRRALEDVLHTNASWHPSRRTVIVAEGLVMYLTDAAVRGLFRQTAAVTRSGSRLVFSYIPSGADGRMDAGRWTGLMMWLQRITREPWLWSIRPEDLGAFLEPTGWTLEPPLLGPIRRYGVEFFVTAVR